MRLSRLHHSTFRLTRESYHFANNRWVAVVVRSYRRSMPAAAKLPRDGPDCAGPDCADGAFGSAEVMMFSHRIAVMKPHVSSDSELHEYFVSRSNAVHLAHQPKKIAAMKPFITAEIHDDKATASRSFLLDCSEIRNCAAPVSFRKALTAISHKC
jgi:hypothetical protein